ncbi:MAG: hypothetical protein JSR46_03945 [Verrucomicrobia bacterium]|nr:hypothetical protein [Verrucomicrobiota bacterium]
MSCCTVCGIDLLAKDDGEDIDDPPLPVRHGKLCGHYVACYEPRRRTVIISAIWFTCAAAFCIGALACTQLPRPSKWLYIGLYVPAGILALKAVYDMAKDCLSISRKSPVVDEEAGLYEL